MSKHTEKKIKQRFIFGIRGIVNLDKKRLLLSKRKTLIMILNKNFFFREHQIVPILWKQPSSVKYNVVWKHADLNVFVNKNRQKCFMERTGFCLLNIARTWTDENIYTNVNSQYLQHIRIHIYVPVITAH